MKLIDKIFDEYIYPTFPYVTGYEYASPPEYWRNKLTVYVSIDHLLNEVIASDIPLTLGDCKLNHSETLVPAVKRYLRYIGLDDVSVYVSWPPF